MRREAIGQKGYEKAVSTGVAISLDGYKFTLADAEVGETGIGSETGKLIISDGVDSMIFNIYLDGGVKTISVDSGSDVLTISKDTASKVNVYFEDDVVKVQNLLGSEKTITAKFYI